VVVSKTDLLANGHADVERAIGAITDAPRLVGSRGAVDVRLLLGVDRDGSPPTRGVVDELAYRTWTIAVGEPTIDELRAIVELIDVDVLRAKGLVACRGETSPVEVHVVGARRVIRRRPDLAADRCDQRLVAIGLATTRPDA
jgi:G3E family GTPase